MLDLLVVVVLVCAISSCQGLMVQSSCKAMLCKSKTSIAMTKTSERVVDVKVS